MSNTLNIPPLSGHLHGVRREEAPRPSRGDSCREGWHLTAVTALTAGWDGSRTRSNYGAHPPDRPAARRAGRTVLISCQGLPAMLRRSTSQGRGALGNEGGGQVTGCRGKARRTGSPLTTPATSGPRRCDSPITPVPPGPASANGETALCG